MKKSGKAIRQLRQKRGWNQEVLAVKSGLSSGSIRRFESGHLGAAQLQNLVKLAQGLNEPLKLYIGAVRIV